MRRWCGAMASALALVAGGSAMAEDRRALVIADDDAARDQAVMMSETLLGLGFDVRRLEAPDVGALEAALADLSSAGGPTVIYAAGDDVPLDRLLDTDGTAPRFVIADRCGVGVPDALPANTVLVTDGPDCGGDLAAAVQERLTIPGLPVDQWDLPERFEVAGVLGAPFVFRRPTSDLRLTAEDYAMLDRLSPAARDRMIALWRKAGIAVDAAPSSATPGGVVADTVRLNPVQPVQVVRPVVAGTGPVRDTVTVVSRPASVVSQVPAVADGLPQPSILVGYVVETLPDAPLVPDEPLAGNAFGADDAAARAALRAQDAVAFDGLLAAGAFDPPEDEVARALQIELARINCYTSGIDGAWGPGSQRALLDFYEEIGAVPPGTDPDVAVFRAVVARDDVRCPDPVPVAQPVAQVSAETSSAAQSRRVTQAAAPAPAPAAQPAQPAAAPAQPARRSISQTGGTGVFR